ncbi:hypothetical protein [Salinibius halmophilus]|uniref:hypothetical protein n=1 Tax=Salinibius halmophilus TaxID=1853216 RepID=UPI000E66C5A1|nr:hypothetical protein [Salinibius halmophilus]
MKDDRYKNFVSMDDVKLAHEYSEDGLWIDIYDYKGFKIAIYYERHTGEQIYICRNGCNISIEKPWNLDSDWTLITDLWPEAYNEYNEYMKEMTYPRSPNISDKEKIIDRLLCKLTRMIDFSEIDI